MKYLSLLIFPIGLMSCQDDMDDDPDLINPDLFAHFSFDSSYADISEYDNTLQAFGTPEFVEGYTNEPYTAVLLDGEDDFLIGNIDNLDTFSISMWAQSLRYFVGEWPRRRSTLFDYSDKQVFGYIDGASGATQINFGLESEQVAGIDSANLFDWFHLYMVVGNDVKIYINGSLYKSVPYQKKITFLSDIIYFGRSIADDDIDLTYFYGKLDEIRIYNRILDQEEIDELSWKP